jgi:hypothetical protein
LTKGHRLQIFGAFVLIWVVWLIANIAITSAVIALAGPVTTALRAVQVISYVVPAFLGAFNAVLVGVFYYQLRVAKDGVDIDKIADTNPQKSLPSLRAQRSNPEAAPWTLDCFVRCASSQ